MGTDVIVEEREEIMPTGDHYPPLAPYPKIESDPTGAKPHTPGAKMDAGKSPIMQGVIQYFPRALKAVSEVSLAGAKKYTWNGWESVPDGINRYSDALGRHLLAEVTEGLIDPDTGCYHAAQVAWNAFARLELILRRLERSSNAAKEST